MKDYTVLLLRPDYMADEFGKDTYMAYVSAKSVAEAQEAAQHEAYKADDCCGGWEDYAVLLVIAGNHRDIKEGT
jgi:hypothetical protein